MLLRKLALRRQAPDSLQGLAEEYGIEILQEWNSKDGQVGFDKIASFQLQPAFRLLSTELAIYSASMIKVSRLKRIILCSQVYSRGKTIGGALMGSSGNLYLPVNWLIPQTYRRLAFHHELYHCFDYHDMSQFLDAEWTKLNEPGFTYSNANYKGDQTELMWRPGFVSPYAMTKVGEDKAELYTHMILHYKAVALKCEKDAILKRKFLRMKELLHRHCPEFDEAFWTAREKSSLSIDDDDLDIVTLTIWEEEFGGKKIWLVLKKTVPENRPFVIYSKPQLREFLSKLGLDGFKETEELSIGLRKKVEVTVKATSDDLLSLGLM
jgi:hypothetical protein